MTKYLNVKMRVVKAKYQSTALTTKFSSIFGFSKIKDCIKQDHHNGDILESKIQRSLEIKMILKE